MMMKKIFIYNTRPIDGNEFNLKISYNSYNHTFKNLEKLYTFNKNVLKDTNKKL